MLDSNIHKGKQSLKSIFRPNIDFEDPNRGKQLLYLKYIVKI